ncbi:MAG: hypothetical protein LW625_08735, partial [Planctomycetaceae bacterium]|nr:hypothetical protein [Planctomycetaceae bacterium]
MRMMFAIALATLCACTHTVQKPASSGEPVQPSQARQPSQATQPSAPQAAAIVPNAVRSSTPWDDGGGPGVRVRTEHYNLHLAVKDPAFRGSLPGYMEACNNAYATALGAL